MELCTKAPLHRLKNVQVDRYIAISSLETRTGTGSGQGWRSHHRLAQHHNSRRTVPAQGVLAADYKALAALLARG